LIRRRFHHLRFHVYCYTKKKPICYKDNLKIERMQTYGKRQESKVVVMLLVCTT
jgi:hypothetical protein